MRATQRTLLRQLSTDELTTTTPFDTLALPLPASLMRRVASQHAAHLAAAEAEAPLPRRPV
jgi:hypothetical protein